MTCRDVDALLTDLQDGRLDSGSELRLHAHLEECASCRARVGSWSVLTPAMRALAPSPPSPFDERRMMAEIERRMAQKEVAPSPRRWRVWATPVLVAAAAACVFVALRLRPHLPALPYGSIVAQTGDVHADGRRMVAARGARVRVDVRATASLTITGPATVALEGDAEHARIVLDEGLVEASVVHRTPEETFAVVTPAGRIEVRGTRFAVAAGSAGSWARVDDGRVALFDSAGVEHLLSAGETRDFVPAVARPAAPVDDAVPLPKPAAPAAAEHSTCRAPKIACDQLTQTARTLMREKRYGDAVAAIEPAFATHAGCPDRTTKCRDELGYLRAEALRLMGRLEDAVAAYRTLDRGGAPAATRQNALYAAAQLERRLGRVGAARVDYEAALSASPRGALREEAMLGALQCAESVGGSVALAAARRYLAAFPTGLGADEAKRIEARQAAQRGSTP